LHHVTIGRHLLKIPDVYQSQKLYGFDKFKDGIPCEVVFSNDSDPIFTIQLNREALLRLNNFATYLSESMEDNFFWRKGSLIDDRQEVS
jgi:hypothetical protein